MADRVVFFEKSPTTRVVLGERGLTGASVKSLAIRAGDLPPNATDEEFVEWLVGETVGGATSIAVEAAADANAAANQAGDVLTDVISRQSTVVTLEGQAAGSAQAAEAAASDAALAVTQVLFSQGNYPDDAAALADPALEDGKIFFNIALSKFRIKGTPIVDAPIQPANAADVLPPATAPETASGESPDKAVTPLSMYEILMGIYNGLKDQYFGPEPANERVLLRGANGAAVLRVSRVDGALLAYIRGYLEIQGALGDVFDGTPTDPDIRPLYATYQAGVMSILSAFRRSTGRFVASLEDTVIGPVAPVVADIDARVAALEAGGGVSGDALAYVLGGVLYVQGDGPDRVLNNDAGKTWISVQTFFGSVLAIYVDGMGQRHLMRVSTVTGEFWPAGKIRVFLGYGQSNAEGQAGSSAQVLQTNYPFPGRLRMPGSVANNIWIGQATTGGTSIELFPSDITGIAPMRGSMAPSGSHGTVSIESAAARYVERAYAATEWAPPIIAWTGAEGGQVIANLRQDCPPGYYAFSNVLVVLARLVAFAGPDQIELAWIDMQQGESNSGSADLGAQHELVRSQFQFAAGGVTGQTLELPMLTMQMSVFSMDQDGRGVRSLLDQHIISRSTGTPFFVVGPCYDVPWSSDFLHNTSVGHRQKGELFDVARWTAEQTGSWEPLYVPSGRFVVTGANEITVTLSEAAVTDVSVVLPQTNFGVTLTGGTIAPGGVTLAGNLLRVTTVGLASLVTAVNLGLEARPLFSTPRTAEGVPRTNIRSTASYGTYTGGAPIHKYLCHQRLTP